MPTATLADSGWQPADRGIVLPGGDNAAVCGSTLTRSTQLGSAPPRRSEPHAAAAAALRPVRWCGPDWLAGPGAGPRSRSSPSRRQCGAAPRRRCGRAPPKHLPGLAAGRLQGLFGQQPSQRDGHGVHWVPPPPISLPIRVVLPHAGPSWRALELEESDALSSPVEAISEQVEHPRASP
jgi:hypothetical protein